MPAAADINPHIVDALYREALLLSDEVREAFVPSSVERAASRFGRSEDIHASCEALRTTTRMMQLLSWLVNHRAFFAGEISEFALRRMGRLAREEQGTPERLRLLDARQRGVVAETKRLRARIARLDDAFASRYALAPTAVERVRHRIAG